MTKNMIWKTRETWSRQVALAVGCGSLLLAATAAQAGLTASAKCEALKNKEAGKYAFCLEKAQMKLVKTKGACSTTTTTACYRDDECPTGETCTKDPAKYNQLVGKCDEKLSTDWGKWETNAGGSCPTTGDEATIQSQLTTNANVTAWKLSGQPRFTDNGDGTITDNQTGLMWEKQVKLDSTQDYANLEDADNYYQWAGYCSSNGSKYCQPDTAAATTCAAGVAGDPTGCDECTGGDGTCTVGGSGATIWDWVNQLNTVNFAGHGDWRVPTRGELESMIDLTVTTPPAVDTSFQGASCGASCTDVTDPACSCTQSSYYWSVYYAPSPNNAWDVYFGDGGVARTARRNFYVRAVRGGS